MSESAKKRRSLMALCLIFFVLQVYVFADPLPEPAKGKRNGVATKDRDVVCGQLATVGDKLILVNGNNVRSGASVFSGAAITTPEDVGASLQLWPLGRIEIAPRTNLQISFETGQIEVNLLSGCAILTTYAGTAGTVKTPQGTVERIGPTERAFIDVCTGEAGAAAPIVAQGAAAQAGAGVCWAAEVLSAEITEGRGFNPLYLLFGAAPLVFRGLGSLGDGRPPVASASGL